MGGTYSGHGSGEVTVTLVEGKKHPCRYRLGLETSRQNLRQPRRELKSSSPKAPFRDDNLIMDKRKSRHPGPGSARTPMANGYSTVHGLRPRF